MREAGGLTAANELLGSKRSYEEALRSCISRAPALAEASDRGRGARLEPCESSRQGVPIAGSSAKWRPLCEALAAQNLGLLGLRTTI